MTNEERGAYITLLCIQWGKGWVTQVDFERITFGMPPHSVGICQTKFHLDANGNLINIRLEHERSQQALHRQKQVNNVNKRWEQHENYAKPMPNLCQTDTNSMPNVYQTDTKPIPNVCSSSSSSSSINKRDAPKSHRVRFQKPTVEELTTEAIKIGLPLAEVDKFVNYYESNGWKIGRNQMESWSHAMRNWLARLAPVEIKSKELDWRDSL